MTISDLTFADSHCHLNYEGLKDRNTEILQEMEDMGVRYGLNVCTELEEADTVLSQVLNHPHLVASVGVHPDYESSTEPTVDELVHRASHPKIAAIGETGLDYYRLKGDLDWQRERFRVHIRAAVDIGKPLIIHTRDSAEDTLRILKEEGAERVGGVMHCFTESVEVAQRSIDLNFLISLSGIVTFKNATQVHDVARQIPLEHLMIETDSPFLAPVPYRGKTNQPAWVVHVAERIAELKGCEMGEVAAKTTANFLRFAAKGYGGR